MLGSMAETARTGSDTTLDTPAFEPPCGVDDPRIHTFGLLIEAHSRLTRSLDAPFDPNDQSGD